MTIGMAVKEAVLLGVNLTGHYAEMSGPIKVAQYHG